MLRTSGQFMIIVLIVGLVLMHESRLELVGNVDENFADFLSRNSHRTEEPAPFTLVEINESSLKEHTWPWTPLDFALFFQEANTFHPGVLATNEVLVWQEQGALDQKLPQYKKILREHILRTPQVLLGAELGFPEDPQIIPPLQEVPLIRKLQGDLTAIPEFTTIGAQPEEDFRLSSTIGFVNVPQVERAFHSVPLLFRYRGEVVPSFTLQAILLWEKLTPDDVSVYAGERITLADQIDIPIDRRGRMRVDFGVPRGRCGFDDLVLASAQLQAQRTPSLEADALTGKLLLLARTDKAAATLPFAATRRGSVGDLLGAAIATIQSRSFMKRAPIGVDFAILILAIAAAAWAPHLRKAALSIGAVVSLIIYVLVALGIFGKTLVWPPFVLPAGLVLFLVIFRAVTPEPSDAEFVKRPRNVRWRGSRPIQQV